MQATMAIRRAYRDMLKVDYDYHQSNEAIDDALADCDFNECGEIIQFQ